MKTKKVFLKGEERYIIVDDFTDEVVDDSNGFGYRTADNAWRSYKYKCAHPDFRERKRTRSNRPKAEKALAKTVDKTKPSSNPLF